MADSPNRYESMMISEFWKLTMDCNNDNDRETDRKLKLNPNVNIFIIKYIF